MRLQVDTVDSPPPPCLNGSNSMKAGCWRGGGDVEWGDGGGAVALLHEADLNLCWPDRAARAYEGLPNAPKYPS